MINFVLSCFCLCFISWTIPTITSARKNKCVTHLSHQRVSTFNIVTLCAKYLLYQMLPHRLGNSYLLGHELSHLHLPNSLETGMTILASKLRRQGCKI